MVNVVLYKYFNGSLFALGFITEKLSISHEFVFIDDKVGVYIHWNVCMYVCMYKIITTNVLVLTLIIFSTLTMNSIVTI